MSESAKKRVAVLISGNGSNLQALIDAADHDDYPAEIVLVISNKADAFGVQRAQAAGIEAEIVPHQDYSIREEFDAVIQHLLVDRAVDIVCLAGFMRLLTPVVTDHWEGRMLNIHPSLLPRFKGPHAIRDALNAGVRKTGCTVHFVTAEMDDGPIVAQEEVIIKDGDTEETLAERVHQAEHTLYPKALKHVIEKMA